MPRDERVNWLARVVPAVVLAGIYCLIAVSKVGGAVDEARAAAGTAWMAHALGALHSMSGAIFFLILGVIMLLRKEPIRRERRLIGWLLPFVVVGSLSIVGGAPLKDNPASVMLVATAFVVVGTVFTLYALRHLGRHFGVVSDVRGLVTSGPYRWVRHPLYAGETITSVGLVLAVASPLTVAAFTIGLALQIWRAKVEEQSLTAAFPEYHEYASRTPMLIPLPMLATAAAGGSSAAE